MFTRNLIHRASNLILTCATDDGSELQAALLELTGQRTVPNIFIGKQHVGGSDDLSDLIHNKAELQKLLDKAFPQ